MSRETAAPSAANGFRPGDRLLGWVLTVGGFIGLLASLGLATEKIETLRNPGHAPSCDINPLLSCGAVMDKWQAEVFGFPNPFLGLMAFPVVVAVGIAVLSGIRLPRWWWIGMQIGSLLGVVFVHWLFFQSLYRLGALCPYCMVVWVTTLPIFWFVTVRNLRRLAVAPDWQEPVKSLLRMHGVGLFLWFLTLFLLIVMQFGLAALLS